ncbi:MAG: ROK family transcriptional regulator [Blastocatellia bacterium]|nr:ROK family transcriptional regulator [Blastocatellia bacterium]
MRKIDLTNFQVATSETARDINRRVMLNLIRQHQPISRADLARHSGLQRSTVSVIAEQLIKERWVTEGAIGHVPRGRRPRFLHLNKERIGVIGVVIRPAQTIWGVANLNAHFSVQESFPTPKDPEQFIETLCQRLSHVVKAHPEISYEGIGIGLPGRVDLATQKLVFAPNLSWRGVDLKTPLERAIGLPVELENAANACALAEVWFGHHSVSNLVAVTVSEGIGAGILMNGQLVRGTSGAAGEFGHVTIVEGGQQCQCGNHGCWEIYASNSAAVRFYMQATAPQRNGKPLDKVMSPTFEDVLRLAEQGAPKAVEALQQMAHYIGIGLALLVTGLAPDVIVIVGEVTRAWSQIGPIIEQTIRQRSLTHAIPHIVPTDPASQPRLRGTIALVLQKHFSAPEIA